MLGKSSKKKRERRKRRRWLKHSFLLNEEWLGIETKNVKDQLYLLLTFIVREEKRKTKRLRKMGLTEEEEMAEKIGIEERKLLIAQRKLESIRVLDELLERVKVISGYLSSCKVFSAG